MAVPPFAKGIVVGYNPSDQDSIVVMFPGSGQIVGYPVKILHKGAADAVRINQDELPTRGTWGLVAFPDNDVRNGIWLGSFYPSKQNAVTSPPDDPTVRYNAHYSGDWDYLDQHGKSAHQWADGSSLVVGASGSLPTTFRQTVNPDQTVSRTAFTRTERIPNPPTPFVLNYEHAAGGIFTIDASGNVVMTLAAGALLEVIFNGGAAVFGADGNITFAPVASVEVIGNLLVTGGVTAGFGTGDSVTLQHHVHTQGNDSDNDTEVPTNAPTPGT